MRALRFIPAVLLLLYSGAAAAQNWFEYVNTEDLFTVNFPEEPTVTESPYISEYNSPFTARKYSATDGVAQYSVTVVNMENSAREQNRRGTEWRGAVGYAATAIRRTGEVTFDGYAEINVIPGQQLQVTLPDGSRNFANVHFHKHRLYIIEAIAPAGAPPPAHFQASWAVIDAEGNRLRYEDADYSFPDGRALAD
jgi:hypothetical protein